MEAELDEFKNTCEPVFYNNLFQLWQMLYTKIYKADSAGIN